MREHGFFIQFSSRQDVEAAALRPKFLKTISVNLLRITDAPDGLHLIQGFKKRILGGAQAMEGGLSAFRRSQVNGVFSADDMQNGVLRGEGEEETVGKLVGCVFGGRRAGALTRDKGRQKSKDEEGTEKRKHEDGMRKTKDCRKQK